MKKDRQGSFFLSDQLHPVAEAPVYGCGSAAQPGSYRFQVAAGMISSFADL
jgi:hypothetical protein